MTAFLVTWEIDIDADTPAEAAAKARAIQLDPASSATVFTVHEHDGEAIIIDVEDDATLDLVAAMVGLEPQREEEDGEPVEPF